MGELLVLTFAARIFGRAVCKGCHKSMLIHNSHFWVLSAPDKHHLLHPAAYVRKL
jgi:hypothetical protein